MKRKITFDIDIDLSDEEENSGFVDMSEIKVALKEFSREYITIPMGKYFMII